jgi:hypothetical protein
MQEDGWWWHPADATDASVSRQILGEMVRARLPWLRAPAHAMRSLTMGSNSSPRRT